MFPHLLPPDHGTMDVRQLFDLQAAQLGHRLLTYRDHHDNKVAVCACEGWQVKIADDDPNPGDTSEDIVDWQWPDHVIDSALTEALRS